MRIYVYVFDRDYKDVDVGNEYRDYISDEIIPEIFSNEDYICISYYVDNDVFGKVWQGEGTKYIYETTDNLDIIITNMFYACDENISRTYIESINAFTEQCIRRINPDDEDILVEYDTSADTSDDELKNQFTRTDRKKLEESLNNQANSFFIGQGNYKSMITHIVEYHDPISFVYEPINISEFDDVFSQDEKENTNDEVVYINNGIFNDFIFHVSNKIKDSEGKSLRFRDAVTRGFIGIKVTISDKESPKVKYTVIYSDELENYDTKKLNDKSAELNSEQNTLEDEVSDDEDSEDYYFIDSDSRYLTEEDLVGLSSDDLVFARNEIYARHGYIFKDSLLVEYFNSKDWYVPRLTGDEFDDAVFNSFEKKNIEFIKSHE
ncbi:MAG: YARHG domain-containing protein [Eubacterium sp.]|nr:YARHG domain-containing protein [Eubacterium sp.]